MKEMTEQEVRNKVLEVIVSSTETELPVTEQTELFGDLGLASVEVFVMLGELEDVFDVEIPASRLGCVRTAKDLCDLVIDLIS
ncbi:MAG: acyl carrier protein [Fusicatenibacter sp.]|nr:acyl carrier protein [Lachnospiraceae bacterium]MDY2936697.1 acyl carrier protein [Fusicatenibacter sp.]